MYKGDKYTRLIAETPVDGNDRVVLRETLRWSASDKSYHYDVTLVRIEPGAESFRMGVGRMRATWSRVKYANRFSHKELESIVVHEELRTIATSNCLANEKD